MKNTKFVKITKRKKEKKKIRKRQVDEEEETIFQGSFDSWNLVVTIASNNWTCYQQDRSGYLSSL